MTTSDFLLRACKILLILLIAAVACCLGFLASFFQSIHARLFAAYAVIVLLSGASGGLIYSMTTGDFHSLHFPHFKLQNEHSLKNTLDTGFLGHMLIGMMSGIVMVSITLTQIPDGMLGILDLAAPSSHSTILTIAKSLFYTCTTSLIGGFLGLRLIINVSDKTFSHLQDRVKSLQSQVSETAKATAKISEEQKLLDEIRLARAFMVEGNIDEALQLIEQNLRIKPTKEGAFTKAFILKRKNDYAGAISTLENSFKLQSLGVLNTDANIFFNLACYYALAAPNNIGKIAELLTKSVELRPENAFDIENEMDFVGIRDVDQFKAFVITLREKAGNLLKNRGKNPN